VTFNENERGASSDERGNFSKERGAHSSLSPHVSLEPILMREGFSPRRAVLAVMREELNSKREELAPKRVKLACSIESEASLLQRE
jgi:hypothetical protein